MLSGGRPPYIPGMTGALRVAALSAAAAVIACLAAVGPGAPAANAQDTAALGESFESVRALPAGWTRSDAVSAWRPQPRSVPADVPAVFSVFAR